MRLRVEQYPVKGLPFSAVAKQSESAEHFPIYFSDLVPFRCALKKLLVFLTLIGSEKLRTIRIENPRTRLVVRAAIRPEGNISHWLINLASGLLES